MTMEKTEKEQNLRIFSDPLAVGIIIGVIAATTAAHYFTPHSEHYLHGIYRRVYYIPIIIAAFQFGLGEALAAAAIVTGLYVPHAFFARFHDPGTTTEKVLEIVLYFAIALVTGIMQSRLKKEVDKRRQMEQALRLKERLTSLGELSAGFAHEVRNPVGSIKGAAQLLLEYFPKDDSKRKLVELLARESDRLEDTVGKFLAFARPSISVNTSLGLKPLISDSVQLLKNHPDCGGKDIALSLPDNRIITAGDPTLLKQVFFNIGLNAIQAMDKGGSLAIGVEQRDNMWTVTFEDNGRGIDSDSLERIFDPFYTTRDGGTGLGLAMSYRIIQEHGGEISVESRKGEGSKFTVFLPASPKPETHER